MCFALADLMELCIVAVEALGIVVAVAVVHDIVEEMGRLLVLNMQLAELVGLVSELTDMIGK